jgi:hypothetical protein
MRTKRIVPTPEKKIVVETGNFVSTGTSAVEPNIASTCCIPSPSITGVRSRSSGATTSPGRTRLPSPCNRQVSLTNERIMWGSSGVWTARGNRAAPRW